LVARGGGGLKGMAIGNGGLQVEAVRLLGHPGRGRGIAMSASSGLKAEADERERKRTWPWTT